MAGPSSESWGGRWDGLLARRAAGIGHPQLLTWLVTSTVLGWAALTYRWTYNHHFAVLRNAHFPQWWEWADQGRYYRAAQAWATGSLDPSRHWYFAGYPLLGAALFWLAPGDPFYLVDALCLLLFGWLFVLLAGRLSGTAWVGRLAGAAVFAGTVLLTPYAMKSFVEPWTTTPTAPLTLAAFMLAFRLWERPTPRLAAALGLATASVLLFRPVDVAPLAASVTASTAWALRSRLRLRIVVAGAAGGSLALVIAAATYLAVFGPHESRYLQQSAQTGFEWRLIPLHWVTLFVSPLPEFRDEFSLSQTFPWIIPGVAGMLACLISSHGPARLRHALVIGAVLLHCLLYLAYRDLHPLGLFRFGNYHYFKWCLPIFGLYAAFLLTEIAVRRRAVAFISGLALAAALFSWRMSWQEVPAPFLADARMPDKHTLALPRPPRSVYDGLFVPVEGGMEPIYLSSYSMRVGDRVFDANADFKAFPVEGGLIFTVLRPMPAGATMIRFTDQVRLLPGPLRMLRAHLFWRWPRVLVVASTYANRWFVAD